MTRRRNADYEDRMAARHWAVTAVFEEVKARKLNQRCHKPFAVLIKAETGTEIPYSTLQYWFSGYSEPKISELEAMAKALGWELELFNEGSLNEPRSDRTHQGTGGERGASLRALAGSLHRGPAEGGD